MTALNFIFSFFSIIINFFFNTFKIPDTNNVYMGWVLVSFITIYLTINTILNLPKVAPRGGGYKVIIKEKGD